MKLKRVAAACLCMAAGLSAAKLPDRYFELIAAGLAEVQERMAAESAPELAKLETNRGWRHFPSARYCQLEPNRTRIRQWDKL